MSEHLHVLLIEDDDDDVLLARGYLDDAFGDGYTCQHVSTLPDALEIADTLEHDVFLVDYRLGAHDGIEFVRRINEDRVMVAPIILLTGQDDRETDLRAMEAGATDYLVKQEIDGPSLERAIRYAIKQKKAEARIQYLAYHDALTGLPNRVLLGERLEQTLSRFKRRDHFGAILFIDLDNFKTVNDSLGHSMGDTLLVEVARRLREVTRDEDTVARLGGDEFVVLLPELSSSPEEAAAQSGAVAEKIRATVMRPISVAGEPLLIGASIGVNLFTGHDIDADTVMKRADTAMYEAKSAGRNTVHFFMDEMEEAVRNKLALENDLRRAVAEDRFSLVYQPQVCVETGDLAGAEALVRWTHPERGVVSPVEFIPAAEQSGLMVPIGDIIFRSACRQLATFDQLPCLAVNISAKQFHATNFVTMVRQTVDEYSVDPTRMELELTESALLSDIDDMVDKMHRLKDMGLRFALDDFGTGYSSLSYLKRMPFDVLKIDRSFIHDVTDDADQAGIAMAIIALGKVLNLSIVGEGVETEDHLTFLKDHGADTAQGYFISMPLAAENLACWCDQRAAS